jgi:2-dehydropantoate 2-reductase
MKIGIVGAGAIGCFLGGRLIAAGHDVVLVGRLGDEIRASGLELTDYAGGRVKLTGSQVRYVAEPAPLAEVSAVFVTVKSQATDDAAHPLASILTRPVPIVSFQNGVSNASRLRAGPPVPAAAGAAPPGAAPRRRRS